MTIIRETKPFVIYPLTNVFPSPSIPVSGDLTDYLPAILDRSLPDNKITRILDRGEWGRRIFEVTLDSGEVVLVKFIIHEDWLYGPHKTRALYNLLHPRGLCATEEITSDYSKTIVPLGYVIERKAPGTRLDRLLKSASEEDRDAIYHAIGRHYRTLYSIPRPKPGYWIDDPDQPFDIHPSEFYLQNDIGGPNGSGYKLVKMGYLPLKTLERIVETWRSHMDELKDHPVGLVHGNAAPWSIYLEKVESTADYHVSRMGNDDCLWWDPAFDLAMLRWPPLSDTRPKDWQALVEAYGPIPGGRRLILYRLMQSLLTACWAYMGPRNPESDVWLADFRINLDTNLNAWMEGL
jgi:hypothetical protein